MQPELVFCASGNRRFAEIAIRAGFRYGARLPHTVYFPPWFADQDWRRPDRAAYMAALAQHRPHMATVLDWEQAADLPEVLSWAEEAAQYVEQVLVVPKVMGGIDRLPRHIGGKDVVLAYSVPTRYGGSELPLWEFAGWPVHLLGGQPHQQMQVYGTLRSVADVVSADGNYHMLKANRFAEYWQRWTWLRLRDGDVKDRAARAFALSCQNIMAAWRASARRKGD